MFWDGLMYHTRTPFQDYSTIYFNISISTSKTSYHQVIFEPSFLVLFVFYYFLGLGMKKTYPIVVQANKHYDIEMIHGWGGGWNLGSTYGAS